MAAKPGSKAPVSLFVEETGKTGFAHLVDLASPTDLAQVNPGDFVELAPEGPRVVARSNGVHIGVVEPRVAARLLRLMADGNKYAAGVTSLGDKDVRIIIRETYQDPANYGKVSVPTAAKRDDLRPYTKGTLVREESDLDDELEYDDDDDAIVEVDVGPGRPGRGRGGLPDRGRAARRMPTSTTRTTLSTRKTRSSRRTDGRRPPARA